MRWMKTMTMTAAIVAASAAAACDDASPSNRMPDEPPPPPAPVAPVEQVRAYPHDSTAFTQGLAWHAGALYESTGRYGESSLRRVDLETGEVRQRVDLPPQYFGEGLATVGDSIVQLTWREGVMFVYDRASLREIGRVTFSGEAWGLASSGESLIVSDGSSYLTFVDPATMEPQRTLAVTDGGRPVDQLNELEWVRGEIWANVWHTDQIVRIDPRTGRVVGRLDLSPLRPAGLTDQEAVLNGIAYDEAADRLLVTGKLWPRLYEIRVPSLGIGAGGASGAGADTADG